MEHRGKWRCYSVIKGKWRCGRGMQDVKWGWKGGSVGARNGS